MICDVLGVVGAGRHAPWQAQAVCCAREIAEVRVYSPTAERREATARDLAGKLRGAPAVSAVDSARAAVDGADVVVPGRARPSADALTLFLSQGVGLWDAALGGWVYDRAAARGVGRPLSLIDDKEMRWLPMTSSRAF